MDTNSSGEDLHVKARKPYTITKQREKWTEEEHNKFLEALKLHGRAWQRIEEHIGTKTAVQIRSHAQKFFTKLEKEAATKGVPFGHAHDIEIPPPRPKRKPSNPYPRKIGALEEKTVEDKPFKSPSLLSGTVNIDNYAAWKIQRPKDASDDNSCSEVINLLHNAPAASSSSLNMKFNRFRPPDKEKKESSDAFNPSQITIGLNNQENANKSDTVNACKGNEGEPNQPAAPKQTDKTSTSNQGYPKNASIDFMKKNEDKFVGMNTTSGISSVHHPSFPGFLPFTQFPAYSEAYRSFFNISSTLSSLIVSTLLQHPAVHAAATVAASYWPSMNVDASTASSSETSQMNPTPSIAAIAAATVAAASAWWATQGLLPLYPPVNTGFPYAPPPMTTGPVVDTCLGIGEEKVNNPGQSEAQIAQSSSSDTDKSPRNETNDASYKNNLNNDVDNLISKKKVDRSSCGSNTPSSSEVETDANLIKQAGEKDETVPMNAGNASLSTDSNRRSKSSTGIMNESWKEVSEEGRIAFRALFSRGVLPQSFSPPQAAAPEESITIPSHNDCVPTTTTKVPVDLNQKASSEPTDLYYIHAFGIPISGKNPSRKTGFKPYKRCSVEAKESRPNTNEENGNKRIRLEGEASI